MAESQFSDVSLFYFEFCNYMGEVERVTVFPLFSLWYWTGFTGGLRGGQGHCEVHSFLFFL